MIILVGGPPKSGKSTAANMIARIFGIPAVINTDVVLEVLGLYEQIDLGQEAKSDAFYDLCLRLRPHIVDQIEKRIEQMKPAVVEGVHLLPELYDDALVKIAASVPVAAIVIKTEEEFQDIVAERLELSNEETENIARLNTQWASSNLGQFLFVDNSFMHSLEETLESTRLVILKHLSLFCKQRTCML